MVTRSRRRYTPPPPPSPPPTRLRPVALRRAGPRVDGRRRAGEFQGAGFASSRLSLPVRLVAVSRHPVVALRLCA